MFLCPVCNEPLIEHSGFAECIFCHTVEEAEYVCKNKHYVCEDCRLANQHEIIMRFCSRSKSTDPVEMANLIMKHPSFNPYGAEHHELVAPVVLTALRNLNLAHISESQLNGAMKRGAKIPYGSCGSMGTCGACVSAGVAVAMYGKSNYLKDTERNATLKTVSNALSKLIGLGGPRCCKYSTYVSIETAWQVLVSDYNLPLKPLKLICEFQDKLKDCKKGKCPLYQKQ